MVWINANRTKNNTKITIYLILWQPLTGDMFAEFCELTKEDTPDPKPYEPTQEELWQLDKEASEERANNMNAYYEGYTNQQHF